MNSKQLEHVMNRVSRAYEGDVKRFWIISLAVAAMLSPGSACVLGEEKVSESKKPGSGNFLVVPITTDLQRMFLRDNDNAKAFVFINAMDPVSKDGTVLDAGAVDFDALRKSLKRYATSKPPGSVVFSVRSRSEPRRLPAAGELVQAVEQLAREIGLEQVKVNFSRYGQQNKYFNNWKRLVSDLTKPPTKEALEAESGVGDDQVKLYSVRTPLSRFLYGGDYGIAHDCVVLIIPPIEEVDAEILATMQRSLPKLKLKRKHGVLFRYHWTPGNEKRADLAREEFCGEHVWKGLLRFKSPTWMPRS